MPGSEREPGSSDAPAGTLVSRPSTLTVSGSTESSGSVSGEPTSAPGPTTQSRSTTVQSRRAPVLDAGVLEDDAVAHQGALLDDHARAQDAADHGPADAGSPGSAGCRSPGAVEDPGRRALLLVAQDRPVRVTEDPEVAGEHVVVRREVLVRLAEVLPVALHRVREHLAAVDEAREQVLAVVTEPGVALAGVRAQLAVQLLEHARPARPGRRRRSRSRPSRCSATPACRRSR